MNIDNEIRKARKRLQDILNEFAEISGTQKSKKEILLIHLTMITATIEAILNRYKKNDDVIHSLINHIKSNTPPGPYVRRKSGNEFVDIGNDLINYIALNKKIPLPPLIKGGNGKDYLLR
jgi:hypothetical protein